jgi:beta-carotene hydroxylase
MTDSDVLDQKAVASASQYMGAVAWPTVILGLAVTVSYLVAVAMALTGMLSLWFAVPVVAVLTYASYTVTHDSIHGSISGSSRSMRWINKALGYMTAWILMIPLTAHRHEHMAHHRHTNDPAHDPDFPVSRMQDSVLSAAHAAVQITVGQFSHYFRHRWSKAPAQQNLAMCLEVAAAIVPRLVVLVSGYWIEGLALFVLAWLLGVVVLLYLFAYIVHRPHEQEGRYIDTSTILVPGPLGGFLTWLWLFQNYHSIHHLFPRVPFYHYAKLYKEIEEIMIARGAPVYRLTARGLKTVSTGLTASNELV